MEGRERGEIESALRALAKRLNDGPLTVWATLREDTYETSPGDGYYAYVEQVFLKPTDAASAIESAPDERMTRWHIRRYDLSADVGEVHLRPTPAAREPTTAEVLAAKLVDAGIIA